MMPQIKSPSDLFSFSHLRNATRLEDARLGALRTVSSRKQGVRATVDEQIDTWQRPSEARRAENGTNQGGSPSPLPRIGIGLPMSNIFAKCVISKSKSSNLTDHCLDNSYFGGSLELISMDGYGT